MSEETEIVKKNKLKGKIIKYVGVAYLASALALGTAVAMQDSNVDHTKEICSVERFVDSFGINTNHQEKKAFNQIADEGYFVYEKEIVTKYSVEDFKDDYLNGNETLVKTVTKSKKMGVKRTVQTIEATVNTINTEEGNITKYIIPKDGYVLSGTKAVKEIVEYAEIVDNVVPEGYSIEEVIIQEIHATNKIQIISKKENLEGWTKLGSYIPKAEDCIFLFKDRNNVIYTGNLHSALEKNKSFEDDYQSIGLLDDKNFFKYESDLLAPKFDFMVKGSDGDHYGTRAMLYNNFAYEPLQKENSFTR